MAYIYLPVHWLEMNSGWRCGHLIAADLVLWWWNRYCLAIIVCLYIQWNMSVIGTDMVLLLYFCSSTDQCWCKQVVALIEATLADFLLTNIIAIATYSPPFCSPILEPCLYLQVISIVLMILLN